MWTIDVDYVTRINRNSSLRAIVSNVICVFYAAFKYPHEFLRTVRTLRETGNLA